METVDTQPRILTPAEANQAYFDLRRPEVNAAIRTVNKAIRESFRGSQYELTIPLRRPLKFKASATEIERLLRDAGWSSGVEADSITIKPKPIEPPRPAVAPIVASTPVRQSWWDTFFGRQPKLA